MAVILAAAIGLCPPIPAWVAGPGPDGAVVPYGVAPDLNTPSPDPGEEHQHVNTQLYGIIDPLTNRGLLAQKMTAPYNAPADLRLQPTMDGFVADYISAFSVEMGREPGYAEYAPIMTGYTPDQLPVTSALARGFATFDHWFCEVPSPHPGREPHPCQRRCADERPGRGGVRAAAQQLADLRSRPCEQVLDCWQTCGQGHGRLRRASGPDLARGREPSLWPC